MAYQLLYGYLMPKPAYTYMTFKGIVCDFIFKRDCLFVCTQLNDFNIAI